MLEKSRNALFFSMFRVSGQSKSRPVKAAGAESCGQRRNQKLHTAVSKSTFWSQNAKTRQVWSTFWSSDVEELHAALARSAFWSQIVKKLRAGEHFLKFWCRKIARCCVEKRIKKSKCKNTSGSEHFFAVLMSKNCTPLWRKGHFEVKMYKDTSGSEHFLKFWCRRIARRCGLTHTLKSNC